MAVYYGLFVQVSAVGHESPPFLSTGRSLSHSASRIAACRRFHASMKDNLVVKWELNRIWGFGGEEGCFASSSVTARVSNNEELRAGGFGMNGGLVPLSRYRRILETMGSKKQRAACKVSISRA
jgi:hypothetical protein